MDNKRTTVLIEVEITDIPMIAEGLAALGSEASGLGYHAAGQRFETIRQRISPLVPLVVRAIGSRAWAEIGAALKTAAAWDIMIEAPDWRRHWRPETMEGHIVITVGGGRWVSADSTYTHGSPVFRALRSLMEELAPLAADHAIAAA